jgi:hypothetical protein
MTQGQDCTLSLGSEDSAVRSHFVGYFSQFTTAPAVRSDLGQDSAAQSHLEQHLKFTEFEI